MHVLPGHIQTFYVTANGRRLGPYYARVWKQGGRRRRQYVPAHMLEKVRAACQAYREARNRRIEKRRELERILGNLAFLKTVATRAKTIDDLLPHEREHVLRIKAQGVAAPGKPKIHRTRRFMGPFVRNSNLNTRGTKACSDEGRVSPVGPTDGTSVDEASDQPTAHSKQATEEPPTPKVMRSWTLARPLPDWLTQERLTQMMSMLPPEKD